MPTSNRAQDKLLSANFITTTSTFSGHSSHLLAGCLLLSERIIAKYICRIIALERPVVVEVASYDGFLRQLESGDRWILSSAQFKIDRVLEPLKVSKTENEKLSRLPKLKQKRRDQFKSVLKRIDYSRSKIRRDTRSY